ncbi:hypothetical protein N9955_00445 [bacterium]|nr:hypothetical protein [bacterium]
MTNKRVICVNAGIFDLTNGKIYPVTHVEAECYHVIDDSGKENFYAKTRFKLMKYEIGQTLVCVNNQDSDSLELNEEYIVVDINNHGNIGVKHPASNSLLRHYYKPERFEAFKVEPEIEFGQHYTRGGYTYVVGGIGGRYGLIDVKNGCYYTYPRTDIEEIFSGDRDKFKRVDVDISIRKNNYD